MTVSKLEFTIDCIQVPEIRFLGLFYRRQCRFRFPLGVPFVAAVSQRGSSASSGCNSKGVLYVDALIV